MSMKKKEFFIGLLVFVLAALFLVYEMAIQVSPSVMTKQLMEDFSIDAQALGWMASVYFYSYTLMQIPAGLLYDRFGPRTLLGVASLLCAFGVLFFSLTTSIYPAAIGRFLMGIGSSFAFIGMLVVASRWFEKRLFPIFIGITQFTASLGGIVGGAPLAKAVQVYGWKNLMWFLMIFGILLALIYFLFFKDHPTHEFADFGSKEHSIMRHLKMVVKKGQTWFCAIYAFTGWGPVMMFAALWGVPYLSIKFNISAYYASFGSMMMLLGSGVASPFIGYLSSAMKRRKPILILGSILGFFCFLSILYIPNLSFKFVLILLFLAGIGTAAHILTFALVSDNNPPSVAGSSIGFNNMAVVIGGAILQPIGGFILNRYWSGNTDSLGVPLYSEYAYCVSLSIIPLLYLIGFFIALFFIKETYCKNTYKE
jgi:MFS family permease